MVRYSIIQNQQLAHLQDQPLIATISDFTSTNFDQIQQYLAQHPSIDQHNISLVRFNVPQNSNEQLPYDVHYLLDITPIDQLFVTTGSDLQ